LRLESIAIFPLKIPFVANFDHVLKSRNSSDSILFKIKLRNGSIGWGETLVRDYVTGETVEIVLSNIQNLPKEIWEMEWTLEKEASSPDQKMRKVTENLNTILERIPLRDGIKAWNGLRCGLELALLDALLRDEELSLTDVLPPILKEVVYSGVITSGSLDGALRVARQMKQIGIKDYKLKISGQSDLNTVREVRALIGPSASLRLDANGAFELNEAIVFCRDIESFNISAIEEPLRKSGVGLFAELQKTTLIPVMPDESLVTLQDAQEFILAGGSRMFNVRLAKCGGIAPCLDFVNIARKNNIAFQLGSLVGESGILSAVGRIFAAFLGDCSFVEGSYGTLLLQEDIVSQSVRFGYGGKAPVLKAPGISVDVVEEKVLKFACSDKVVYFASPFKD
jgi:L-alanine-DL-glutamate epimerase-like enolase superfamily enzyme